MFGVAQFSAVQLKQRKDVSSRRLKMPSVCDAVTLDVCICLQLSFFSPAFSVANDIFHHPTVPSSA